MRRSPLLLLALAMLLAAFGPVVTSAQTPAPVGDSPLMSLLHRLPNNLPSDGWIHYANYELQLETMGIDARGSDLSPEEWVAAIHGVMVPYTFTIPTAPEWREGLGFDMRDVDAFAELRSGDMSISVFAGDFDADALPTVWEAAGYAPVEEDGVTWYTLGDDHALIFDHPTHSMHLGSLSHLVVLDDGTVAGTATRADMEAVIALSAGDGSSFADGRGAVFQDAPDDLVASYIYDGSTLIATVDPLALMPNNPNVPEDAQERLATQVALMAEEAPRMPPIHTALIGVSAGAVDQEQAAGGSQARSVLVVVPLNEGATAEVAETLTRRLTTLPVPLILGVGDQPYSTMFSDMVIETPTESPVVVVDLVPADDVPATVLITLLNARQLTVLSWTP